MNSKRVSAVLLALLMIFSLTACKASEETSVTLESTTAFNDIVNETVADNI